MKAKLQLIISIIMIVCLISLFLPIPWNIKFVFIVVFLITFNFSNIYISAYGILIFNIILIIYSWFLIDKSTFCTIFMVKNLYKFILLIVLYALNIIIVSFRLIIAPKPLRNQYKYKQLYWGPIAVYRLRFLYPIIAFLFLVTTIIYSFAGVYNSYEEKYYGYYTNEELISNLDNTTKVQYLQSKDAIKSYAIYNYDKNYKLVKKTVVDICDSYDKDAGPLGDKILIYEFDSNNKNISSKVIQRGFYNPNNKINLLDIDEAIYFSYVTYFTVGYGDITPRAMQIKQIAEIEMFLGYIITGLFIPILLVAIQKFVDNLLEKYKSGDDESTINSSELIKLIKGKSFNIEVKKVDD